METIALRDAIRALRTEIIEAAEDASTQAVRFELGPIELEFQVVAKTEFGSDAKIGAKIGFHILSAEATLAGSGKGADERTQKVKLVLTPILIGPAGRTKLELSRDRNAGLPGQAKAELERP